MRPLSALCLVMGIAACGAPPAAVSSPQPSELTRLDDALRRLAQQVEPSVVQVLASGYTPIPGGQATGTSLIARRMAGGSGVILTPDGYIATNHHVVEGASRLQVRLARSRPIKAPEDGGSVLGIQGPLLDAAIVGVDPETDLAILKVEGEGLPHQLLGDSDRLQRGQMVLAFGSPRGLQGSVSLGIVSTVARQLSPDSPMVYVQTDAPINPGDSGGPLVGIDGQIVGLNTLIASEGGGSEGLGFAVPANIVREVFEQIRKHGRVRRGIIGVESQTLTPVLAYGLGLDRSVGVILSDVLPFSPAAKAGLRVGDVVVTVDHQIMENARQFDVTLYRRAVGDKVILEVLRQGKTLAVPVTVAERPDDPTRLSTMVDPQKNQIDRLGVVGVTLSPAMSRLLPALRSPTGVVVATSGREMGPEGGFLPGDVIYAINGRLVPDVETLKQVVESAPKGHPLVIQLERRRRYRFMALEAR